MTQLKFESDSNYNSRYIIVDKETGTIISRQDKAKHLLKAFGTLQQQYPEKMLIMYERVTL